MKISKALLPAVVASLALTSCSAAAPEPGPGASLKVAVAFYPFEYVATRVAGAGAVVTNLTQPGAEPHDLELTPQQVASLAEADVVIYQRGFQPALDTAVTQANPKRVVDAASFLTLKPASGADAHAGEEGGEHAEPAGEESGEHPEAAGGALDPHTWLDPTNLVAVAEQVRLALTAARPSAAEQFAANARALTADLTALDTEIKTGLAQCRLRTFITSHAAFGYFAGRYGLTEVGIRGLDPDVEPSAARIAEIQQVARSQKVRTIFFETLVSPAVAQTVAGDLGLATDVLDPLEGITAESRGPDYPSVMRANAAALAKANQCP